MCFAWQVPVHGGEGGMFRKKRDKALAGNEQTQEEAACGGTTWEREPEEVKAYITSLLGEIHCHKARAAVGLEMLRHINDQREVLEGEGNSDEDAVCLAVREMGDPVEVGMALDQIHRPKPVWSHMILIVLLTAVGWIAGWQLRWDFHSLLWRGGYFTIGIAFLLSLCLWDYTRWGRYCLGMGAAILLLDAVSSWHGIYGAVPFLGTLYDGLEELQGKAFGGENTLFLFFQHLFQEAIWLYTPVFAAILYHYRNKPARHLWKVMVWLAIPFLLEVSGPYALSSESYVPYGILLLNTALFLAALWKGWYPINKRRVSFAVLGAEFLVLLGQASHFFWGICRGDREVLLRMTGWNRLFVLFSPDRFQKLQQANEYDFMVRNVKAWQDCRLWGMGEQLRKELAGGGNQSRFWVMAHSGSLSALADYFGIIPVVIVLLILFIFLLLLLRSVLRQPNVLGRMIGLGAGMVIALYLVVPILFSLSLFPWNVDAMLPLVAVKDTSAAMLLCQFGILLNVYRYQHVFSSDCPI